MPFNWFKKTPPRNDAPGFWKDYLRKMETPCPRDTPIRDIPFVVIDTETTGLDRRKDRILSIAALRVQNWSVPLEEGLEIFVSQRYEPASASVEVHGILPVERAENLKEQEAIEQLVKFLGNGILAGHHVDFDLAMVNQALKRHGAGPLRNQVMDTARLARRLNPTAYYPDPGGFGLDRLCERFHIPLNDRHTASGDAFLTAILLLKLLGRLEKRGIHRLKDF